MQINSLLFHIAKFLALPGRLPTYGILAKLVHGLLLTKLGLLDDAEKKLITSHEFLVKKLGVTHVRTQHARAELDNLMAARERSE